MVNLRPTSGWDRFTSLGHPCKFQQLSHLDSVTARHSSSERQPSYAALNRGRHLCLAGRPSRWALAHISSFLLRNCCCQIAWWTFDDGVRSLTITSEIASALQWKYCQVTHSVWKLTKFQLLMKSDAENEYGSRLLCFSTTTRIVLRPFDRDYPDEPVPEETFTHPPTAPHGAGALLPLSIHFLIFCCFLLFLFPFLICFTYFLLLSIPSLFSTRIVPLHFQAVGRRRRANLALVCLCWFRVICIS